MTSFQPRHPDSNRDLALSSEGSLDLLDSYSPKNSGEIRIIDWARGVAEAVRDLAKAGAFTPEGLAKARDILDSLDAGAGRYLPPRPVL